MELEVKHLAPYLPYGLRYHLPLESERFESIMEDEPFKLALPFMSDDDKETHFKKYKKMSLYQSQPYLTFEDEKIFLGQMQSSLGFEDDDVFLHEVKPILRPLSQIKEYFEPIFGTDKEVNEWLCEEELHPLVIEDIQLIDYAGLPYGTCQVLFKHHFDVFGLIDAGLAIDINTLSV